MKTILILLCILLMVLVGCENSFETCHRACRNYIMNCSSPEPMTGCIHIPPNELCVKCTDAQMAYCIDECAGVLK
jgi:hypothetical protein